MAKFPPIRALYCNHPFAVHLVNNKDVYFEGFQSDIFNSFVPKKIFNITFTETRDCYLGIRSQNGSYDGMLGILQRSQIDLSICFARQNMMKMDDFFLSPTISCEHANYYYFLKMNLKWADIMMSSVKIINNDVCLLFFVFILASILFYLIRFKRLDFMSKLSMLADLFFKLIQLVLQHSVKDKMSALKNEKKMTKKNFHLVDPRLCLLFTISITFFFINYFLASINNSFIEIDKSEFLDTIENLALHPVIYPVLSKNGNLQAYYNDSQDKVNKKIWQKMVERGLDESLISFKAGDIVAMINCLKMLKEKRLAYIVNGYGMSIVKSGYCSSLYQSNKKEDDYVMWLSKLFAPMLISIPYNLSIDPKLKMSLDKHFLTYGFTVDLYEKVSLKLSKQIGTKNSNCIINERKAVIDSERHSSLRFENFMYAFWMLISIELISLLAFIVYEKVLGSCYMLKKKFLFCFYFFHYYKLMLCFCKKTAKITKKSMCKLRLSLRNAYLKSIKKIRCSLPKKPFRRK